MAFSMFRRSSEANDNSRTSDDSKAPDEDLADVKDEGGELDVKLTIDQWDMAKLAPDPKFKFKDFGSFARANVAFNQGEQPKYTFQEMPGSTFRVRMGPNYAKTGRKEPSIASLYKVIAVDIFSTPCKLHNIGKFTQLPEDEEDRKACGIPLHFIICASVPAYAPSNPVWGKTKEDGGGWLLIYYLRLTDESIAELKKRNPPSQRAAIHLLKKFVLAQHGPDDPMRARFKAIANFRNPDEAELGSVAKKLVLKYNSKPFLLRTTTTYYRGDNYFEIDVDVHRFSYLSRVGFHSIAAHLPKAIFELGFVVEGHKDDELPEQMLAGICIHAVDVPKLPKVPVELVANCGSGAFIRELLKEVKK